MILDRNRLRADTRGVLILMAIGIESLNRTPMAISSYGVGSSMVERCVGRATVVSSNLTRHPSFSALLAALTAGRASIITATAAMTCKPIIGTLAVNLKEIRSDLPQLPFRMPQVWEAR